MYSRTATLRLFQDTQILTLHSQLKVPHFSLTAFSFLDYIYKIKRETILCRAASKEAHEHTKSLCKTIPLCGFWNQKLHIWKFLEPLGSHGNVAVSCLQLHSRGHSYPLQGAQPDKAQDSGMIYLYPTAGACARECVQASLTCAPLRFVGWPSPWPDSGSSPGPAACSEEWWTGMVDTGDLHCGKRWTERM